MGKLIVALYLAFAASLFSEAAIRNAASASDTDINTEIDAATTGDTIIVPAGDVTWTTSVNLDGKNLTIIGNGIGSTIIRRSTAIGFFSIGDTASTISGFDMRGGAQSNTFINVNGDEFVTVYDCNFETTATAIVRIIHFDNTTSNTPPKGLVYDCTASGPAGVLVGNRGTDGPGLGATSDGWFTSTYVPGTQDVVVIEDCTFSMGVNPSNAVDVSYGSAVVFRYNEVTSTGISAGYLETHGTQGTTDRRVVFTEFYNNTIIRDTSTGFIRPIWIRGGTSLVYNNLLTVANGGSFTGYASVNLDSNNRGWPERIDDAGNWPVGESTTVYHHFGSDNASTLTATGASWSTNQWQNMTIYNITDGSSATISSNDGTTVTATLSGGTDNDWDQYDRFIIVDDTEGTHDGSGNAATLSDSTKSWGVNDYNDGSYLVFNVTDGSRATITANDGTTVTGTLSGGTDNDWDANDVYKISRGYPWRDQIGTGKDVTKYDGTFYDQTYNYENGAFEWNNGYDSNGDLVADSDVTFLLVNDGSKSLVSGRDYHTETQPDWYTPLAYPHPLRESGVASFKRSQANPLGVIRTMLP